MGQALRNLDQNLHPRKMEAYVPKMYSRTPNV